MNHICPNKVKVANGLDGILPTQPVETQLDARHAIQADDGPFEAKASHAVEVLGSHHKLSNMKGVSSIPPSLDEALHQGSNYGPFRKKANDG